MEKRIIILGGGYGGVLTAKKLAKRFKKDKGVSITLIDKNPFHTLLTELHEVAADRVPPESIRLPFCKIFAGRGVNIVCDRIANIDFKNKKAFGEAGEYEYDYLVFGLGAEPTFFSIPGAEEFSYPLWSYDNAIRLREQIYHSFRTAACERNPEKKRELLTFVVAGAGFTGVEMAGELAEWAPILCDEFKIPHSEVNIYLVDALGRAVSTLPEALSKKAYKRLSKMGVKSEFSTGITGVGENYVKLGKNGDEITLQTRTVIWTAGVQGREMLKECDILKAGRCRIQTDKYLRAEEEENVYVVGDSIYYIPEGEDEPVPQMVENAEHSAALVAHNLAADICGGEKKAYKPQFHGIMVCIGSRYGIAYLGGKKKFSLPSFFAMFAKHGINALYFFQVAGWSKAYSYIKQEIFQTKYNRSFTGGYFSNSSPNFWKAPLRVFVGINWLISGIGKMTKVIANPREIFLFNIPSDAVSSATDAVSAASEAAEAAGLPVPAFLTKIVDWTMAVLVKPIAPVFQAGIVFAELILGVLFIIGLFTAPAGVLSVLLCLMIYSSGMASYDILWYLFASIALIGGSGGAFGMDYYVLPRLKRWWKNLGFVKKWYIYNE